MGSENETQKLQREYYQWMRRMNSSTRSESEYAAFVEQLDRHAKSEQTDPQAWRLLSEALLSCPGRTKEESIQARKKAYALSKYKNAKDRKWLKEHEEQAVSLPENAQSYYESQFSPSGVGLTEEQFCSLGRHLDEVLAGGQPDEVDHFHECRNWLDANGFSQQSSESIIQAFVQFGIGNDFAVMELSFEWCQE